MGGRLGFSACVVALGLALPSTALGVTFKLRAPAAGSVVIAQIKGRAAAGHAPLRLKLKNAGALGGTVDASSTWRAKRGSAYDGIVVLLNPRAGKAASAAPRGARGAFAVFTASAIVSVHALPITTTLLGLLLPAVQKAREQASRQVCK